MITLLPDACNGCGICVKVCPHRVLALSPDRRAVLIAEKRCIECGACQLNCREDAIVVAKGVGCLVAIVREDILKLKGNPATCGCGG